MESICALHGCMAVPPKGTGDPRGEVLYDLLEVRITGLNAGRSRMFSSPICSLSMIRIDKGAMLTRC